MPLLVQTLVQQLGLRSAIRISCVAFGSLVLCGLVWKPTYLRDVSVMPHGVGYRRCLRHLGRFFNYSVWTNADYALWTIAMVLSASGRLVPAMFLVSTRAWTVRSLFTGGRWIVLKLQSGFVHVLIACFYIVNQPMPCIAYLCV